jgi:hypothetical protein
MDLLRLLPRGRDTLRLPLRARDLIRLPLRATDADASFAPALPAARPFFALSHIPNFAAAGATAGGFLAKGFGRENLRPLEALLGVFFPVTDFATFANALSFPLLSPNSDGLDEDLLEGIFGGTHNS